MSVDTKGTKLSLSSDIDDPETDKSSTSNKQFAKSLESSQAKPAGSSQERKRAFEDTQTITVQRAAESPSASDTKPSSPNEYEGFLCFKKLKPEVIISDGRRTEPYRPNTNYLNNKKYNFLTFVPIILINQFSFFFNLYFLALCMIQLIPIFQVGFFITYVGPLAFVLGLTMVKEWWDDHKRYKRDKKYNEELYWTYVPEKQKFERLQSQFLRVGDIVSMSKGQRIPADLVVLATLLPTGDIYLKTDQLDGETDWKVRESVRSIQSFVNSGGKIEELKFEATVPRPTNKIYEFRAKIAVKGAETAEPLRLQNTAWASTTVASGDFYGLVTYVGKDTRIQMNANSARVKFPICDYEINNISKILFVICIGISFFLAALKSFSTHWYVNWILFLVLLCCIIPQSLRTNLDVVKLIYAYRINRDKNIEGTICRNSQMTEDLGRISFLLSDKTGTLTQNEMIFKKITTGLLQFTEEEFGELKNTIKSGSAITGDKLNKKIQDLNMLMYSLVLCNNVTPCFDNAGARFLQSSSPDEIALVDFAEKMGFFMEKRERERMWIKEPSTGEAVNQYTILENFPFSSARKRMGILLRIERTGKMIYFLKGADTVIKEKVERNADVVVEEADNLAKEGLRTLAFCYKFVEEPEYEAWKRKYQNVTTSINCTEEEEDAVVSELERGMRFVGISGVEDLLQENIRETIESLREASIKVWVLTGDKVETAKCIAKATGLKHKSENFFEMLDEDQFKIESQIAQLAAKKEVLVMQGNVLAKIYEFGLESTFFTSVSHLNAIMFCRCSPTQKAQIVKSVQKVCSGVVCAIGDGGNDVSMIQQADVGVGIEGKEGLQAAMSSDFSILKFKFVKDLLFWHGRRATLSTAYVTLFVMHRGFIIAMIQFCFSLVFYLVPVSFYNPFLIMAYTIVYLVLPVIVLATVEDVTRYHATTYPQLYIVSQQSKHLKLSSFYKLVWKSVYQAVCIFLMTLMLFENSFLNVVTTTFSALVMTELLNVVTLVDRMNKWILGANLISLFFYIGSLLFLRDYLGLQEMTWTMLGNTGFIVCACWLPFEVIKRLNQRFFPTISDKIMMTVLQKDKNEPRFDGALNMSSELLSPPDQSGA